MKKTVFLVAYGLLHLVARSQKPIIDSLIDWKDGTWPHVSEGAISDDGVYGFYFLRDSLPETPTFIVQKINGDNKQVFHKSKNPIFSDDWVIFLVGDSTLYLQTMGGEIWENIDHVSSYQIVKSKGINFLIYQLQGHANILVVRQGYTGEEIRYLGVSEYSLHAESKILMLEQVVDSSLIHLSWVDLNSGNIQLIWTGKKASGYKFDKEGKQIAFYGNSINDAGSSPDIWYYKVGMKTANVLVKGGNSEIYFGLRSTYTQPLVFNSKGDRLFFQLSEVQPPISSLQGVAVDIWNYRDQTLQSEQLMQRPSLKKFWAVVSTKDGRVLRLHDKGERIRFPTEQPDDQAIVYVEKGIVDKISSAQKYTTYTLSAVDGHRQLIPEDLINPYGIYFSPDKQWLVWFNPSDKTWHTYNYKTGKVYYIGSTTPYTFYNENIYEFAKLPPYKQVNAVGLAGWVNGGNKVLIYDNYDIWAAKLDGTTVPVNLTGGYGRSHSIKFRIVWNDRPENIQDESIVKEGDTLLLSGFNKKTKENGFFRIKLGKSTTPEQLYMVAGVLYLDDSQMDRGISNNNNTFLRKAKNKNVWILNCQSETEAPNFYSTEDFKNYIPLSDIQPEKKYNWITTELLHWPMSDGHLEEGILYKPENFDPNKKYPLIFHYYEQKTDGLHLYQTPELCGGNIDIAHFVSRSYLVFMPNIHYKIGHPGQSALQTLESAAKFLMKFPYVDGKRLGLQGHSFGGFETNYIITHSKLFGAAAEAAGASDLVGLYNSLRGVNGFGSSRHDYYENFQGRIGATLWQHPELYLENSPILRADKATTPLLIMHNRADPQVLFMQGIELFNALKRLNKKVWMLQYDGEGHELYDYKQKQDYTRRLLQYFDHYLKDTPAPVWMTQGIPAKNKGRELGLSLDLSGQQP